MQPQASQQASLAEQWWSSTQVLLRTAVAGGAAGAGDAGQLGRAVKGLLNRLTEATLRASVAQGAELLQAHNRAPAIAALTGELLQARPPFTLPP